MFKHGFVCDDIRQEDNGKYIVIGMYSGAFVPARLPIATQLVFGVWAVVEEPGKYTCEFEVVLEPDGSTVGSITVEFEMPEDERQIFMNLPGFPVNLGSQGFIVLREVRTRQEVVRLKVFQPPNEPMKHFKQSASSAAG